MRRAPFKGAVAFAVLVAVLWTTWALLRPEPRPAVWLVGSGEVTPGWPKRVVLKLETEHLESAPFDPHAGFHLAFPRTFGPATNSVVANLLVRNPDYPTSKLDSNRGGLSGSLFDEARIVLEFDLVPEAERIAIGTGREVSLQVTHRRNSGGHTSIGSAFVLPVDDDVDLEGALEGVAVEVDLLSVEPGPDGHWRVEIARFFGDPLVIEQR